MTESNSETRLQHLMLCMCAIVELSFASPFLEIDPSGPHKRGPRRTDDRWEKPQQSFVAFDFMPEKCECDTKYVYGRDFLPHFK